MLILKPKDIEGEDGQPGKHAYFAPQYRLLEKVRARLQAEGHSPGPWEVTSRGFRMIAGARCLKCRRIYLAQKGDSGFEPLPASKIHAEQCRFAKYVTIDEAAARLQVKRVHLTKWGNDGRLAGMERKEFRAGRDDKWATTAFLVEELDALAPRIQRQVNKKGHTVIRLPWPDRGG